MEYITGILIDPYLKKLTNVNVGTDNTLQDMYKHIGCSMVEVVNYKHISVVEDIWVDEEALLKRDQRFFKVSNLPYLHNGVIAGRGLILGSTREGGTISTSLCIEEVTPRISWDFEHNGKIYNSETGLFTELKVIKSDLIDSIKSIHVIE